MSPDNDNDDLYDQPLQVLVHENAVVLAGPGGFAVAMTAKAAAESAALLAQAVENILRRSPGTH